MWDYTGILFHHFAGTSRFAGRDVNVFLILFFIEKHEASN